MVASANRGKEAISFGFDSVVIKKHISDLEGGRTLDVAGYPLTNVLAGSVAIQKENGDYAPMPIKKDGTNEDGTDKYVYDTLPEGAKYVGIVYRSISTVDAQASIMFDGIVNEVLMPYGFESIKEAFLTACPHIILQKDIEA